MVVSLQVNKLNFMEPAAPILIIISCHARFIVPLSIEPVRGTFLSLVEGSHTCTFYLNPTDTCSKMTSGKLLENPGGQTKLQIVFREEKEISHNKPLSYQGLKKWIF
jgi:hypothetical protein